MDDIIIKDSTVVEFNICAHHSAQQTRSEQHNPFWTINTWYKETKNLIARPNKQVIAKITEASKHRQRAYFSFDRSAPRAIIPGWICEAVNSSAEIRASSVWGSWCRRGWLPTPVIYATLSSVGCKTNRLLKSHQWDRDRVPRVSEERTNKSAQNAIAKPPWTSSKSKVFDNTILLDSSVDPILWHSMMDRLPGTIKASAHSDGLVVKKWCKLLLYVCVTSLKACVRPSLVWAPYLWPHGRYANDVLTLLYRWVVEERCSKQKLLLLAC